MKIKVIPLGKKLMLDIPETSAGGINIIQGAQIQEQGVILAVGPDVSKAKQNGFTNNQFEVGQTIQFKAWAVDIITIDKQKYYYIDADSDAICGLVKQK